MVLNLITRTVYRCEDCDFAGWTMHYDFCQFCGTEYMQRVGRWWWGTGFPAKMRYDGYYVELENAA